MVRRILMIPIFLGVLSVSMVVVAADPGDCLSAEEAQLLELINQHRIDEGHATVPWSKSLTQVAQWHVWDLETNHPDVSISCNMHSWSDQGIWTPVCYTSDHANAAGMWIKPSEITVNVYSANGYEIAYFASAGATPQGALAAWKRSSSHNDVILNQGMWASRDPWPAMGAGIFGDYAVVWFGDMTDPRGEIGICGDGIFSDGFEVGHTGSWSTTVQ